jgi:hypothetical protein
MWLWVMPRCCFFPVHENQLSVVSHLLEAGADPWVMPEREDRTLVLA